MGDEHGHRHLALGERETALRLLVQAVEERSGWQPVLLAVYPPFDPLGEEPRFGALLRRVGLVHARPSGPAS